MSKFVILFAVSYIGGLAAALFSDAIWGIYLYELQYFLNPPVRWWYGRLPELRYSFIIAVFIMIAYIIRRQRYAENRLFAVPQTKWLVLDMALFAMISMWAVWPDKHSETLINHVKLLIFMAIAYKVVDSPKKFEGMIWGFLAGNFYLGWEGHGMGRTFQGRAENFGPSDTGGDGNSTAGIMISAIPIILFYLLKGKIWQRILSLLFAAFIMDGVVLVNSRGAFIGIIVSCAYSIILSTFLNRKATLKENAGTLFIILLGAGLFLYMTDATFWERMSTITAEADSEYGGGGRKFFWMKTFDLVKAHPFGTGTWGYQFLSPSFIPQEFLTEGRRAEHSIFFQCLAEKGYIGLVIFMGLLISNFRLFRKTRHSLLQRGEKYLFYQCVAIESGFVAFLTASIFLNHLQAEVLYWFMLFIASFFNIHMIKSDASGNALITSSSSDIS